jgi:uncharacterized protein (DUF2336 family)
MTAKAPKSAILNELEDALAHGNPDLRARTLRRVTDLFVFGSSHFSDDHIALFGGVFNHLIADVETAARAVLAERLRHVANAPAGVIRTLAFDDAISVAGPVLSASARLDNVALVENALTKGQGHLLAISQRQTLAETITDVLVERGNRDVVLNVARNSGAQISDAGYVRLVKGSEGDDELAQSVGSRPEISRQNFLKLLTSASKAVRQSLEAVHPEMTGEIGNAVAFAAADIQTRAAIASHDYGAARILVKSLRESQQLSEIEVDGFARAGKFEETAVALAVMCRLPVEAVERAMVMDREEGILIVGKAIDLSWPTARSVLNLCASKGSMDAGALERCRSLYASMKRETALQVVKYQRENR